MTVRLSQTAPWNPRLGNPYRTRWAQVGDRYFKVSADGLNTVWDIEEVDAEGKLLVLARPSAQDALTMTAAQLRDAYVFGFNESAYTLAEARRKIEHACR